MFAEPNLRELLDFSASAPILSIYLNTDPSEGNADAYKLRLRNMLKGINMPQDVEVIEQYMSHQYDWAGRGVAMYSCAADNFFRTYPLAVPVKNIIHIGNHPSVKPLADLMDNFGGYGVVLIDKQGARLFYFHLGQLREQEGVMGESVKHTKRGGASSFPGRRGGIAGRTQYVDELIDRNMKDSAEFAVRFFEENHIRRILIGGTDDNIAPFRSALPKAWQSLIMGTFAMSMTASHTEVLNRAMEIGMEAERKRETDVVENLITAAAKGANASIGLEAVMDAANNERIQSLVLTEGFHTPGYRCPECGLLKLEPECRNCNKKTAPLEDIVESIVGAVMRHGGQVEVVHENLELEQRGKIGAYLRY